ncbi:MAG TPA: hypothetical protein VF194_08385 [Ferrovibrio sp.]|uniref:hypothetical protein n=1 Tax=Ferrovibrio sp. TaxID=1917215 RepID=UPI002ECFDEAA
MTSYKLPSILFISTALATFYAARLIGRGDRRRQLPRLLQSFIRSPELTVVDKVGWAEGHCYVINLERDVVDDQVGISPLMVLENGRPLPLPHAEMVASVKQEGGGRYVHLDRFIYFSPSDNADLRSTQRRYAVIETLTRDLKTVEALLHLQKRASTYRNVGLFQFAKLQTYLGTQLQVGESGAAGDHDLRLKNVELALEDLGFGRLAASSVRVAWSQPAPWGMLDIIVEDLTADWLPSPARLTLSLGFKSDASLRLERFAYDTTGELHAKAVLNWREERLASAQLSVTPLDGLRRTLIEACGGEAAAAAWLRQIVAAIGSGDLPLVDHVPEQTRTALIAALSPSAMAAGLDITLGRENGALVMTCGLS